MDGMRNEPEAAYFAEYSVLKLRAKSTVATDQQPSAPSDGLMSLRAAVLKASGTDVLPKQPIRRALIDSFFTNICHTVPVLSRPECNHSMLGLESMRDKFGLADTAAQRVSGLNHDRQILLHHCNVESIRRPAPGLGPWTDEQQMSGLNSLLMNVQQWCPDVNEILSDPGIGRVSPTALESVGNPSHWSLDDFNSVYDVSDESVFTNTVFDNFDIEDIFGIYSS
ncbi:uncharacterized protein A1O9_03582 [Exophiala aquamarina CBS 119918]|uniref:Uncharacterized protein n=1 Tax=Exophiala aquamarina CBS 119918 TaxID=1182545 RepID=A0A072Q289_9EURO|nr:uncharacterized protein A1O9_03582 [Exophiala aquamarina CBS 119918]KEF62010.1 hypothetical protein A1O9_03582 [Exophiala aquamarina CBS 119918]